MLPMMCIQPACMNIAVRMVIQWWPATISAGISDHCSYKCVTARQFQYEDERVHDDDCTRDDGKTPGLSRCVPNGIIPPTLFPPFLGHISVATFPTGWLLVCASQLDCPNSIFRSPTRVPGKYSTAG